MKKRKRASLNGLFPLAFGVSLVVLLPSTSVVDARATLASAFFVMKRSQPTSVAAVMPTQTQFTALNPESALVPALYATSCVVRTFEDIGPVSIAPKLRPA